ncbi:sensor histidine kinase [Rossellomorea aquimaris]|uniref:Heme sensor protein HssS n=1 Tax=Rossellomorea aquimaris TaxID=189382 RepID=A0A1J6WV30_9BACI|nr:HAMP domain-containing sensor histidine kinase [Rossellomorea aquimaris]OIU71735.1 two-component sensor histidine kinase [Rossellomorea aquimaris]
MRTLYRKFVAATLSILSISLISGLFLTNWIYLNSTKQKIDQQNVGIAKEIVASIEGMQGHQTALAPYLESVGKLGYQVLVIDEDGDKQFFGEEFAKTELSGEARKVMDEREIYHGMSEDSSQTFMMGHFSNDVRNTVGVPFTSNGEQFALFMRPNNKLLFSDIHMILAWFILAVSIFSIIGMTWFAKHLIKPITQLTEATKELTRENFKYELNISRRDEIGQLAQSFTTMQRQLQHNDEARKSFISNVSHDFQSPLMNIQGYADLLKAGVTKEESEQYLGIIDDESKRLSHVTKQLLIITSLDQKAYPMKISKVQVDDQIKQAIRRYQWLIEEKELEVSYNLAPCTFKYDAELMSNVWDNFMTNAIKYSGQGDSIWIGLEEKEENLVITFKDTGIGMTQNEMDQIFDRFYRVDAAREKGGTGLGLSIVKQIIDLHQGKINVKSKAGEGTIFTITLPVI